MPSILVTGGSGFIGTNFVQYCLDHGIEVLNFDIAPPRNSSHQHLWREVDLHDKKALEGEVAGFRPDYVLHLGARTDLDGRDPKEYSANTAGTLNLIEALKRSPPKRALFASSRLVCAIGYQPKNDLDFCPTTAYGESKKQMELSIRREQIPFEWAIVRPTSIWGPWFHVPYRTFFNSIQHGRYLHPRHAVIRKSFGFVGNSVHQLQALLFAPVEVNHQVFYVADYDPIEVGAMADMIQQQFGAPPVKSAPLPLLRGVAKIGDGLKTLGWKNPPLTTFRLENLLTEMLHDTLPLQKIAPELPFTLKEGIAQTVQWMKDHGNAG